MRSARQFFAASVVLSLVLTFGQGASSGVIKLSAFCIDSAQFASKTATRRGGIKPDGVGLCATEGAGRAALRARVEKYPRQDSNL